MIDFKPSTSGAAPNMLTQSEINRLTPNQHAQYIAGDADYQARFEVRMREHFAGSDSANANRPAMRQKGFLLVPGSLITIASILTILWEVSHIVDPAAPEGFAALVTVASPWFVQLAKLVLPVGILMVVGGHIENRLIQINETLSQRRR